MPQIQRQVPMAPERNGGAATERLYAPAVV